MKNKIIVFMVAVSTVFLQNTYTLETQNLTKQTKNKAKSEKAIIKETGRETVVEAKDFKNLGIQKTLSLTFNTKPLTRKEKKPIYSKINNLTKKNSIKEMPFEGLKELIACHLQLEDYDSALTAIKHAFNTSKDSNERRTLKLTEADTYFAKGSLKKAIESYTEFLELYPGAKKEAEYAHYKNIVTHKLTMLKPDQDQTKTLETLALTESYLAKSGAYTAYCEPVKEIQKDCYKQLYQHEVEVFEFYLHGQKFDAAQGRLATIKDKYVKKIPVIEPDALQLEYKLATAQGLTERADTVLAQLATRFPEFSKTISLPEPKNNKRYVLQF